VSRQIPAAGIFSNTLFDVFFEIAQPASLAAMANAIDVENDQQDALSKHWQLQV